MIIYEIPYHQYEGAGLLDNLQKAYGAYWPADSGILWVLPFDRRGKYPLWGNGGYDRGGTALPVSEGGSFGSLLRQGQPEPAGL